MNKKKQRKNGERKKKTCPKKITMPLSYASSVPICGWMRMIIIATRTVYFDVVHCCACLGFAVARNMFSEQIKYFWEFIKSIAMYAMPRIPIVASRSFRQKSLVSSFDSNNVCIERNCSRQLSNSRFFMCFVASGGNSVKSVFDRFRKFAPALFVITAAAAVATTTTTAVSVLTLRSRFVSFGIEFLVFG